MRALLRLFLLSAIAAIAALPALAGSAAADRTFKVTAEGSATYSRYDDSRQPGSPLGVERSVAVSYRYRVTIPRLTIDPLGRAVIDSPLFASGTGTGGGSDSVVIYGEDGDKIVRTPGECVAPERQVEAGGMLRRNPDALPENEAGDHLIFLPYQALGFEANCSGPAAPGSSVAVWGGEPNAFEQRFFLPKLATDQGKVIVNVDRAGNSSGPCPGMEFSTKACKLDWSGKLIFELIDVAPDPIDPTGMIVPLPGGRGTRPGPAELEEIFVPIKPKVSPDGRRASVEVRCRSACAGVVRAYAAGGRSARASRPAPPLASRRFSAGAGRSTTVTLAFRGAARQTVRRTGAVRLVISAGGESRSLLARR